MHRKGSGTMQTELLRAAISKEGKTNGREREREKLR